MGIDLSELGGGRGQRMLIRSPHGKSEAWKIGQPFQAGLPVCKGSLVAILLSYYIIPLPCI